MSTMFKLNVINKMPSTYVYLIGFYNLWDGRLGHVHYNKIRCMENLGLITYLGNVISEKCNICNK